MADKFNNTELRVLGCLIEKQLATPAYYPLTLNSLLSACNQRSNRDPVVDYSEGDLEGALQGLMNKGIATRIRVTGSRVEKYGHTVPDALDLSPREIAVMAELMLRGAQTPGELNQRASRMANFDGLDDMLDVLDSLQAQELLIKLERLPGKKERRYKHLLGGDSAEDIAIVSANAQLLQSTASVEAMVDDGQDESGLGLAARVDALELEVAELKDEINKLRDRDQA